MNDTMKTTKLIGPILGLLGIVLAVGGIGGAGSAWTIARLDVETHIVDKATRQVKERIGSVVVPVGSIVAYHQNPLAKPDGSAPGNPMTLPDGWRRCNGDELKKEDYKELFDAAGIEEDRWTIPNLNSVDGYDGGRFLRGSPQSGFLQKDAIKKHKHSSPEHAGKKTNFVVRQGSEVKNTAAKGDYLDSYVLEDHTGLSERQTKVDEMDETRPVNMSVVWIMRVK